MNHFKSLCLIVFLLTHVKLNSCAYELNKCACQNINLFCSEKLVKDKCGGSGVSGCAVDCEMYVSESVCITRNLDTGIIAFQEITKLLSYDIKKIKDILYSDSATPENIIKIINNYFEHLIFTHEIFHVCSSENYPNNDRVAREESHAFDMGLKELNSLLQEFCLPTKNNPLKKESTYFCKHLCNYGYYFDLLMNWNYCIASQIRENDMQKLSTKGCCNCYHKCKNLELSTIARTLPDFCKQYAFKDIFFKNEIEKNAQKECDNLAFDAYHYSCSKLSGQPESSTAVSSSENYCNDNNSQNPNSISDLNFERW